MKALFIGDIVGKPGRIAIKNILASVKKSESIDLTVANVENAAGGFGLTIDVLEELKAAKIDVFTSGNHIWDKKEALDFIDTEERLLRPANYPPGAPGRGSLVIRRESGSGVAVINLQGRVFMKSIDCPFRKADEELEKLGDDVSMVIVDMHCEATSEKQALAHYLDGRVSVIFGSHTHVQTADERIMPGGTGFITDTGMTGGMDSVIGANADAAINRFLYAMPNKMESAKGDIHLQGAIVEIDETTGKAVNIKRISIKYDPKL